jgi:hypothetical protein
MPSCSPARPPEGAENFQSGCRSVSWSGVGAWNSPAVTGPRPVRRIQNRWLEGERPAGRHQPRAGTRRRGRPVGQALPRAGCAHHHAPRPGPRPLGADGRPPRPGRRRRRRVPPRGGPADLPGLGRAPPGGLPAARPRRPAAPVPAPPCPRRDRGRAVDLRRALGAARPLRRAAAARRARAPGRTPQAGRHPPHPGGAAEPPAAQLPGAGAQPDGPLGVAYQADGAGDAARSAWEEARQLFRRLGNEPGAAAATSSLAQLPGPSGTALSPTQAGPPE